MNKNSSDQRSLLREALLESYLHRKVDGCACAICGAQGRSLAFHVLEKSIKNTDSTPDGFVSMSITMGYVKGSFPVCSKCAPPCSSCKLPIDTPQVRRCGLATGAKLGVGHCRQHIHWRYIFYALFSRLFGKS